jgi:hypothetical protein
MRDRETCVDCKKPSPETDTNYTLISAEHGWRLHRTRAVDGTFLMEWRCPTCWQRFKEANGAPPSSRARPKTAADEHPAAPFRRAARRLLGHNSEPPNA